MKTSFSDSQGLVDFGDPSALLPGIIRWTCGWRILIYCENSGVSVPSTMSNARLLVLVVHLIATVFQLANGGRAVLNRAGQVSDKPTNRPLTSNS